MEKIKKSQNLIRKKDKKENLLENRISKTWEYIMKHKGTLEIVDMKAVLK